MRGFLGGLVKVINDVIKVFDVYGCDVIFVEIVGVGQIEVDIVKIVDMVVFVIVFGFGDDIQVIKVGFMEIVDIFVINKVDKEGVDVIYFEFNLMFDFEKECWEKCGWWLLIVEIVVIMMRGICDFWKVINDYKVFFEKSGEFEKKRCFRVEEEIKIIVLDRIVRIVGKKFFEDEIFILIEWVVKREIDLYFVVDQVIEKVLGVKV